MFCPLSCTRLAGRSLLSTLQQLRFVCNLLVCHTVGSPVLVFWDMLKDNVYNKDSRLEHDLKESNRDDYIVLRWYDIELNYTF
jgi:hypothetical protein